MSRSPGGKSVSFQNISRHYGSVRAVDGVSLKAEPGEFVSLLGPSGSGKTTLLMMLAGFETPTAGRVLIGDTDVTDIAPNKRDIGMVFQKYALFPHMSVARNIAFPLRMRGIPRADRDRKIRHALEMVQLTGYEERMPAQLSGGQQQRVALARAIVFEPTVILMDEPLGALDRQLRQHMQVEIKLLQGRLGATVIYVTHDQEEALTMADRVAILNHGHIMQYGAPQDLYRSPSSSFVAGFLGEMNFLPAEVVETSNQRMIVRIASTTIGVASPTGQHDNRPGQVVYVGVRPEAMTIAPVRSNPAQIAAEVKHIVFNGASSTILLDIKNGLSGEAMQVRAHVTGRSELASLRPGDQVAISWSDTEAKIFPDRP
jgi:spermidine/putrescine ABC transporter ATP-binding subunit